MDWTTIMLVLAGITGVVVVGVVIVWMAGWADWMNRGSH